MAVDKIKILKFGSDPEFLLRNKYTRELVSSIGIIPGTKENPIKVKELGDGYTIQIDNVLGEISVEPANSPEELWNNIQKGLEYINTVILPEHLEIFHASSGTYSKEELNNPIAQLFGCSPSMNAWSETDNEPPMSPDGILFRGCGCHIHLSYEEPSEKTNYLIGRVFDLFCTLPSMLLDEDTNRRTFYGKSGEIRHCSYGVELRTLGGFILSDKDIYDYIMNNLLEAIDFINSGKTIEDNYALGIQFSIDNQNKEVAIEMMEKFNILTYNKIKA